jgi:general secretion pathway protein K
MSTGRETTLRAAAGKGARKLARQRGVAVITALLLTTLAITVVASLFWQQQVQVRSIENQRLQLQKQWILRGALDWARLILREDAKFSTVDSLDEPWAVPLSETRLDQYVEEGRSSDAGDAALSGSIIDAQSRFNLANLAPNGGIISANVDAFARLLSALQLDPGLAPKAAEMMRASSAAAALAGSKQVGGSQQGSEPASQELPFTQVEDLLAVPGFTTDGLERLRPFVAVLPRPTPVNINTAPPEVIAAAGGISQADAASLVASRQSSRIRDMADANSRVPNIAGKTAPNAFAVATNFFFVNGHVRMSRAGLDVQALIERNGAKTNVVWVREY